MRSLDEFGCVEMSAAWQLDATTARLFGASASATIDLAHPEHGAAIALPGNSAEPATLQILGIETGNANTPSGARLDAYVRGADLVAIYEESPPAQLRTQCYWRIIEPNQFAPQNASEVVIALDLILSVNTSLLENNPQSRVSSHILQTQERFELVRDENQQLEFKAVKKSSTQEPNVRPALDAFSIAAARPDLVSCKWCIPSISTAHGWGQNTISHQLFQQRLEKGVILRSRVRAAVLRRNHDLSTALAAYETRGVGCRILKLIARRRMVGAGFQPLAAMLVSVIAKGGC